MNAPHDKMLEKTALSLLARSDMLSALGEPLLDRLRDHIEWITVAEGEVFIREGDASEFAAVVVTGSFEISKVRHGAKAGSRQVLSLARSGSVLGEMGLLTTEPRYVSCTALQSSLVGVITRQRFIALRKSDVELYASLVTVLAGWLAGRLVLVTDVVGDLIKKQEISDTAAKRILDMAMAS